MPPSASAHPDRVAFESFFDLATDLFAIAVGGRFTRVNRAWERTLGWTSAELLGRPYVGFVHPDDRPSTEAIDTRAARASDWVSGFENRWATADGEWRTLRWQARWIDGAWYASARDVTERNALAHEALHDPLTGALNRVALMDRLVHALARARRTGRPSAVLFLDLDGFKAVNDALGHAIGDQVLRAVAARLSEAVRGADTVARLGGDEFVVLLEEVGDTREVAGVVERVRTAFAEPVDTETGHLAVGASIGVALGRDGTPEGLLHEADVAMYRAKAAGRNRAVWFDSVLREELHERHSLAGELRGAVGRGEIVVHYQPIVTLPGEAVVGCEALVRWRHPERGVLPPGAFLPIAEEDGDIVELGDWVLREACGQGRRWRRAGHAVSVAVNVSARQLSEPGYAETVAAALRDTGMEPRSLVLEVTETALLREPRRAARALGAIKALGVRLALDDFGRGYSSLQHLRTLPVDVLKIDGDFVGGLASEGVDAAIVRSLVSLAEATGMTVIAEGVETEDQARLLASMGCRLAQGHWFGRPAGAEELTLDGFLPRGRRGVGDPFVIREFMRQLGVPARLP